MVKCLNAFWVSESVNVEDRMLFVRRSGVHLLKDFLGQRLGDAKDGDLDAGLLSARRHVGHQLGDVAPGCSSQSRNRANDGLE